jgi:hypothetical protein
MPLGAFQQLKSAPGGPPRFFPGAENEDIRTAIAREKQLNRWRREKKLNLIRTIHPEFKDLSAYRRKNPVLGLRSSKRPEQHG